MPKICACLASALFAAEAWAGTPWFNAGIGGYAAWPERGEAMSVAGAGVWTGTWYAELKHGENGKSIAFDMGADDLAFSLADIRDVSSAEPLSITAKAVVTYCDELPAVADSDKGGIAILAEGYSRENARYYGLVRQGDSNVWARLDGALPPEEGAEVGFLVELKASDGGVTHVRYSVDGVVLSFGNGEWNEIVCDAATVSSVNFKGRGELAALSGRRLCDVEDVAVSVPGTANASVASVSYAGVEVSADAEGCYSVPAGAFVCVRYEPSLGYVFASPYVGFRAEDASTAVAPTAVNAKSVISITEIMPSNGTTLKTANGGEGIDWIEIRNTADFAIDLTGWYLSTNPDKKPGKWGVIEGDGTIPANGYKVVWADESYSCWAKGEAHATKDLSVGGKPLFLADPRATKAAKESTVYFEYTKAIKDVSIGFADGVEGLVYYREPTPGAPNGGVWFDQPTAEVAFSVPHGYKDAAFDLELSCPADAGAAIYYTTNGTSPNATSAVYTEPIRIGRTTVVRAATLNPNAILQQDTSATYLFLDDILAQGETPPDGFPADKAVNNQVMHYGMHPDIVAEYRERIMRAFTNDISTVSLVIDPANLFNASTGIYVNAWGNGREWERQVQVELFSPTGAEDGFSLPAGLRIRGGASRGDWTYKHSFRLFFRSDYGANKLKYAMFPDDPTAADECDKIDLRTSQNFSWQTGNDSRETFIHELFARDCQRDLGQPYNRSRYYNLFINGIYWGLYQTEERVDDTYAENYGGGSSGDYDVIRTSQPGYITEVAEGNDAAWHRLWDVAVNEGFSGGHAGNYRMLIDEGLLNPTNLMAYMLVSHYIADTDCPNAATLANERVNNLQAFCNRAGTGKLRGFIFNKHDAEWSLVTSLYNSNEKKRDTVLLGTDGGVAAAYVTRYESFGPAELHWRLMQNAEYKSAFMDYARRELTTGALSDESSSSRFRARMAEIDNAIACESARWGHRDHGYLRKRDTHWVNACSDCLKFINGRGEALMRLYESHEMMPSGTADALTNAVVKSVMAENDVYGDWLWEDIAASAEERTKAAGFAGTGDALKSCLLVGMPIEENPEVELSIPEFGFNADGSISIGGAISIDGVKQARFVKGRIRIYGADSVQALGESVDAVDAGHEFPFSSLTISPDDSAKSRFFQLRLEP